MTDDLLASVMAEMNRAYVANGAKVSAFVVRPDAWEALRQEMKARYGIPFCSPDEHRPNFVYMGKPVVIGGDDAPLVEVEGGVT